jgi:hypothetical protein
LKAYAKKNQVNDAKWNLVTGDKKRDIHAGQKILLGCKIGQAKNYTIWCIPKILFWSTPKKEFVAFMTEQRHQTTYRRHYFLVQIKNLK